MPDNVVVLDADGNRVSMRTRSDGVNEIPVTLADAGDGIDFSNNPPSLPGSLLVTIPANPLRAGFFIQSQDTGNLTVVLDDQGGSLQYTVVVLGGADVTGDQGGSLSMSGMPHSGRIRIYAAGPTYQMAARDW